ncbi:fibrinogen-like protein A [Saccoglossus kowalevskii]
MHPMLAYVLFVFSICYIYVDGQDERYVEYSEGFGEVYGEFWLGNDNLFYLTNGNGKQYELRVDLTDWRANSTQAIYSGFRIEDAFNRYRLWLSFYGGAAGDSMSISNGAQFSTFDSDNDDVINADYGKRYSGGWWYSMWFSDDHTANLNGKFYDNDCQDAVSAGYTETGVYEMRPEGLPYGTPV